MPPNERAAIEGLKQQGIIPAAATAEQSRAIYLAYIQKKLGKGEDRINPLAAAAMKKDLALGKPQFRHGRVMRPNNQRFDNLLVLLVEFGDEGDGVHSGPLHNQMPKPQDPTIYWVPDFSAAHYQQMLFSRRPGDLSMANYYLEQSGHTYALDGITYAWVKLNHSQWFYGADSEYGTDDLNGPVWRLVQDVVAASPNIPWSKFDLEDPYDLDGDGNLNEPDGWVDHLLIAHAGGGEEADVVKYRDSVWSHSWFVDYPVGCATSDSDVQVGAYTVMCENGGIGVFSHEFGHDLGLPDLYDTLYTGEASTAFWTLMAAGSWLGYPGGPLDTCPAPLGAWEKYLLGWLDPVVVNPGEIKNNLLLRTAAAAGPAEKAILVNLPDYPYSVFLNQPYAGSYEWYSGQGDYLQNTLTREITLPATGAAMTIQTWFDIEEGWDFGYVDVSADGGATWTIVPALLAGETAPVEGLTGYRDEWVRASYDLSAYNGQTVLLRFRYSTDTAVQGLGWTIDNITIGDFVDGAEDGNKGWTASGWSIFSGTDVRTVSHFYMMEWRTPLGFNVSMNSWPNWYAAPGEFVQATPGMLVWYRNSKYNENWVGWHPGAGMMLAVDSHPELLRQGDVLPPPWNVQPPLSTLYQMADATFAPWESVPMTLTYGSVKATHGPFEAVPEFNDSLCYFDDSWSPITQAISSVLTPTYGLKARVVSGDKMGGRVKVDFSGYRP